MRNPPAARARRRNSFVPKVRLQGQEGAGRKTQEGRGEKDRIRSLAQGDGRRERRRSSDNQHRMPGMQERHGVLVDAPDKVGRRSDDAILQVHKVQPYVAQLRLAISLKSDRAAT